MPADPPERVDPSVPDSRAVRRHFARAAATYDGAAVLQKEVGRRMSERLEVVKLAPTAILDLGCGTGDALSDLGLRYPDARRVALDIALPMLHVAKAKTRQRRSALARLFATFGGDAGGGDPAFVCGDVAALPFAPAAFDLVWSNLALQWASDLPLAFAELLRVLRVGGLITFTTLGPDTLKELRAAFAGIDRHAHAVRFTDMHDIGDMMVHAGFAEPVMHMEVMTLTYGDAPGMLRDLKAIGATNAARARPRALMGRQRWQRALAVLQSMSREGRIPATFEVIYGHAWKAAPVRTAEGHPIVHIERRKRG